MFKKFHLFCMWRAPPLFVILFLRQFYWVFLLSSSSSRGKARLTVEKHTTARWWKLVASSNRCICWNRDDARDFFCNARERRQRESGTRFRSFPRAHRRQNEWMETKRRVSFRIIIQTKTREKYISLKKKEQQRIELTTRRRRSTSSPNRSRSLVLLI